MEIVNVYAEDAPAARLIGRRYLESDRAGGSFAAAWDECFAQGLFERLEALMPYGWRSAYPEGGSYVGLLRPGADGQTEYWIGMLLPPDTPVPARMAHVDVPAGRMGVCWVKGTEPDIIGRMDACRARLEAEGMTPASGAGALTMERYQCPRFTAPDAEGRKILDVLFRLEQPGQSEPEAFDRGDTRYCGACYAAFAGDACPECGQRGSALEPDDPILIGVLPAKLRNALQIAFAATEIPFTAIPTLGSGFTLAAGDIFETYRVFVPWERAQEAAAAMEGVLGCPPEKPKP